ncbi:MAG: tyrosine-type recombinase/integrase, partial [Deltaproteobacteria bacterium]|nr:tyrosine-type recombinase/integrase [Deltaproteobacteria bacterium]
LWIEKYIEEGRRFHALPEEKALFVSAITGEQLSVKRYSQIVKSYVDRSGIEKEGACHIFRHTMATLMLENGADVRFIQEMLGHQNLSTTQIYTRVSITKLKEVHEATHPAAFMMRTKNVQKDEHFDDERAELISF